MDLIGQRFGLLEVIGYAGFVWKKYKNEQPPVRDHSWYCLCDCGVLCKKRQKHLRSKAAKSCGCGLVRYQKEWGATRFTRGPHTRKLYKAWYQMNQRCHNNKHKSYKDYGGRGITVCDEWRNDYPTFYEWGIASGFDGNLSIERIDNDGGYSPENCKWIPLGDQQSNTRRNRLITFNGKTQTLTQWAKPLGIIPETLARRLDELNWGLEEALTTPRLDNHAPKKPRRKLNKK